MDNECVFNNKRNNNCNILITNNCDKCNFRKTEKEYIEGFKKYPPLDKYPYHIPK